MAAGQIYQLLLAEAISVTKYVINFTQLICHPVYHFIVLLQVKKRLIGFCFQITESIILLLYFLFMHFIPQIGVNVKL
jgi:hypothetical protein